MPAFPSLPWLTNPGQPVTGLNAPPPGGFQYQNPMQGMGFMDRMAYVRENNPEILGSLAAGFISGDPATGIANATSAMGDLRKQKMAEQYQNVVGNQTKAWLLDQGYSEADANAAMMNPEILNSLLKRRDYELQQEAQAKYATEQGGGMFGTPIPFQGPKGEFGMGVLGKNAGEYYINGQPAPEGWKPVDIFSKAAQAAAGGEYGETAAAAPQEMRITQGVIDDLDAVLADPDLDSVVGWIQGKQPRATQTSGQLKAQQKIDKLVNNTWLQARGMLTGQGQITNLEADKAQAALIAASQEVDETEFRYQMGEFRKHVQLAYKEYEQKAKQLGLIQTQQGSPFFGGNTGGGGGGGNGRVLSVRKKGE